MTGDVSGLSPLLGM